MHATLVPSSWRSGTRVTPGTRATHASDDASGRSAWATIPWRAPRAASASTPSSTAVLRPRPGDSTMIAPWASAHSATSASSHTTATGRGRAARTTVVAIDRASAARSAGASAGARRRLASEKAFTGTSTATGPASSSTARSVGTRAEDGCNGPTTVIAMPTKVAVIGAGSWGTAVAAIACNNSATVLWARRPELADEIRSTHRSADYLPGY